MIGTVSFECCLVEKISPEKEKWKSTMKRGVTGNCIRLLNEKTLGSHPEKKEIYLKPDFYLASIKMVRAFENWTQGSSLWLICANSVQFLIVKFMLTSGLQKHPKSKLYIQMVKRTLVFKRPWPDNIRRRPSCFMWPLEAFFKENVNSNVEIKIPWQAGFTEIFNFLCSFLW